jgi:hypothetical protein
MDVGCLTTLSACERTVSLKAEEDYKGVLELRRGKGVNELCYMYI